MNLDNFTFKSVHKDFFLDGKFHFTTNKLHNTQIIPNTKEFDPKSMIGFTSKDQNNTWVNTSIETQMKKYPLIA